MGYSGPGWAEFILQVKANIEALKKMKAKKKKKRKGKPPPY